MIIFCSDLFVEQALGGAELTTEAIMLGAFLPVHKVLSQDINIKFLKENKNKFWIFGNYSFLSEDLLFYIAKNIKYAVIEYDYKYCKYRLPELHKNIENEECNCQNQKKGKIAAIFLRRSRASFWMSKKQLEHHEEIFPFLKEHNNVVLSSVFSKKTIKFFKEYKPFKKEDKWGILGSTSWVKGTTQTIAYADKEKINYEIISGLSHHEFLKKLSTLKGLIFRPTGRDTCPRVVIEAKLLDCELDLNENVQHKNEEWFENKEKVINFLEKRTEVFWKEISKHISELSNVESEEKTHFKIIVPFYNTEKWIEKCIDSIKLQDYNNFKCYLIDDVSTDNSAEIVKEVINEDNRFYFTENKEKQFALHNIHDTIKCSEADDNDVIILLDGDDWLSGPNVLSKLDEVYESSDCLLTYGSYVFYPFGTRGVEPSEYSKEVIENNQFREDKWRASHLRSFKHLLWKNLNKKDLKYKNGKFFKMTYDQAIMLPMLEMAADRIRYIDDILYVYNKDNPLNIDKSKAQEQYKLSLEIRNKKKYKKI